EESLGESDLGTCQADRTMDRYVARAASPWRPAEEDVCQAGEPLRCHEEGLWIGGSLSRGVARDDRRLGEQLDRGFMRTGGLGPHGGEMGTGGHVASVDDRLGRAGGQDDDVGFTYGRRGAACRFRGDSKLVADAYREGDFAVFGRAVHPDAT